jgi:hypothetical protein
MNRQVCNYSMLFTTADHYKVGVKKPPDKSAAPKRPPLKICRQPGCLLQKKGVDAEYLSNLIVHVLAGESLSEFIPESGRIVVYPRCKLCALRVLAGGKAYVTEAEYRHLVGLGGWHSKRQWRRERRSF